MPRKILVTGGAGFIGSHIVEQALLRGDQVIIVDDFSTGKHQNVPVSDSITLYEADIRDKVKIRNIFELTHPEIVFHEAAIASVQRSIEEPAFTRSVNVEGSRIIFEMARDYQVKTVVFASSAAIYGSDPALPKAESMVPKPISPYGEHKLENEQIAKHFSAQGGTTYVGLRYFNVFGPRQDPKSEYSGVISIFMDRVRGGEDILIHGDGVQSRDFVYVKDVVVANLLCAEKQDLSFGVYNVGAGSSTTIQQMAEAMFKANGVSPKIRYGRIREGDIRHSLADISSLKATTGFHPRYELNAGLREMMLFPAN